MQVSPRPNSFQQSRHTHLLPHCGTPLTFTDDASLDETDVTTCSLDDPGPMRPQSHIFISNAVPWLSRVDELPQFLRSRTQG